MIYGNSGQYFGRVDKNKKKGSGEFTFLIKINIMIYSMEKEFILGLMEIYMKVILKMG